MLKMGKPILDLIYPVGSVYVNNANTDPNELFGGAWELINKEFSSLTNSISTEIDDYFTPTDKVSSSSMAYVKNGNSLNIRLLVALSVGVGETNVEVGAINLEKFGISRYPITRYGLIAGSDSANCIAIYQVTYEGVITILDIITKDGSNEITSGKSFYFDILSVINSGYMLDKACNKFYWQRTA